MKLLTGLVIGLFSSVFIVLTAAVLVLMAPGANTWLIDRVVEKTPGLTIRGSEGLLLIRFQIHGLVYETENLNVQIEKLEYKFGPLALFEGIIQFDSVIAKGLSIIREGSKSDEQPLPDLTLPLPVRINSMTLTDMTLQDEEKQWSLKGLQTGLQLWGNQLRIDNMKIMSEPFMLAATGKVRLKDNLPFEAELSAKAQLPDYGLFRGEMNIEGDIHSFQFTQQFSSPFSITTKGKVSFETGEPYLAIQGNWNDLIWPLTGDVDYSSNQGGFSFNGLIDSYSLQIHGDVAGVDIPESRIALEGRGDSSNLTLNSLLIKTLEGKIQCLGHVGWRDALKWDLKLSAKGIQPSQLFPDIDGVINMDAKVSGEASGQLSLSAEIVSLKGTLFGNALNGRGDIQFDGETVTVNQLTVHTGENKLLANGILGEKNDLNITLMMDEPSLLMSELSGNVHASAVIKGSVKHPVTTISLTGKDIAYNEFVINKAYLESQIDWSGKSRSTISIQTDQILMKDEALIDHLTFEGQGDFSRHVFDTAITGSSGEMKLGGSGQFDSELQQWLGRINTWTFSDTPVGDWNLEKAGMTEIRWVDDKARINGNEWCWNKEKGAAMLCLQALWSKKNEQKIKGYATRVPLSIFSIWYPGQIDIEGLLSSEFSMSIDQTISAQVKATSEKGAVHYEVARKKHHLPFRNLNVVAAYDADRLTMNVGIDLNKNDTLKTEVSIDSATRAEETQVQGQVAVDIEDLGFLNMIESPVTDIHGTLKSDFNFVGKLNNPEVIIKTSHIMNAGFSIPELGISITDINMETAQDDQGVSMIGNANIDDDTVSIQGDIISGSDGQKELQLTVQGHNLKVLQLPEAEVWIDPDLQLRLNRTGINLKGKLGIPRAIITYDQLPENVVTVSTDEIIITKEDVVPTESSLPFNASLIVELGDNIQVTAFGLDSRLEGSLRAEYLDSRLRLFNKVNLVDGKFKAYGQDLNIDRGRLIFAGPIDDPGIDLLASRPASEWDDKVVAYFKMTGTLKRPESTVYTIPSTTENEALAYLVTGGPLGKTDSSVLTKALLAYSSDYLGSVKGTTGIDELDVKSSSLGQNSLVVGKRISPNLYVSYLMDLISAQMLFVVEYKLTEHLSIEAKSGETHGGDIKYSIEFD